MNGTVNKVILIGNLGDDIKMHYFDDKNCIGRFPIATSESYLNKETNEKTIQTEWHNIVTRNRLAEVCNQYLSKGDRVYIEGKIKTRKWDDHGNTKYATEIFAETIQFLTTKKSDTQKIDAPEDFSPQNIVDDLPF